MLKFKLTFRAAFAFAALLFVMHESHEIVHTVVARLICGCWGPRDFNVWKTCETCMRPDWSVGATVAGPLFTFAMIWWGFTQLKPGLAVSRQAVGLAMVFANMPFARILTAVIGGGDEVWSLNELSGNHLLAWATGVALVLGLCALPLWRAAQTLLPRRRWLVFTGLLLGPVALDLVVVLLGLNTLLEHGVLAEPGALGSPLIVNLWSGLVVGVLVLTWPALRTVLRLPALAPAAVPPIAVA